MSDSCNLSSEAEKEICKDEMINASVSMIPGIGPVIGNAIQRVTAYEKKINKDLVDAQGKLDQSEKAWQQDVSQLTGDIATDLQNLVYLLVGDTKTGHKSIIEQMVQTDIFPLERIIGYLVVTMISAIILLFNLYV